MLEQAFDERERVRGMSVLAHEHATDIVARQSRFELTQFIGVEFVDLHAVLAPQFPGEAILSQAFRRAIDIEVAEAVDEILGAGGTDQRLQGFKGWTDERTQCASLSTHLLRRARADEPNQPRSDRREVAPAQRNGPSGSKSQRGTFLITPGIDTGVIEE